MRIPAPAAALQAEGPAPTAGHTAEPAFAPAMMQAGRRQPRPAQDWAQTGRRIGQQARYVLGAAAGGAVCAALAQLPTLVPDIGPDGLCRYHMPQLPHMPVQPPHSAPCPSESEIASARALGIGLTMAGIAGLGLAAAAPALGECGLRAAARALDTLPPLPRIFGTAPAPDAEHIPLLPRFTPRNAES